MFSLCKYYRETSFGVKIGSWYKHVCCIREIIRRGPLRGYRFADSEVRPDWVRGCIMPAYNSHSLSLSSRWRGEATGLHRVGRFGSFALLQLSRTFGRPATAPAAGTDKNRQHAEGYLPCVRLSWGPERSRPSAMSHETPIVSAPGDALSLLHRERDAPRIGQND